MCEPRRHDPAVCTAHQPCRRSWARPSGLYALADAGACAGRGVDLEPVARAFVSARLPLVQVRAKSWSTEQVAELVTGLLPDVAPPTRLILNDHLDLVLRLRRDHPSHASALGLHVGQGDVPLADVRRVAPDLFCGISTHDAAQVEAALAREATLPSYLAFGPVFPTASKHNPEPTTGVDALAQVHQRLRLRGLPLVAIGGIQTDSVDQVASHCELVASISMMLPPAMHGNWVRSIRERSSALNARICAIAAAALKSGEGA